jgi:hypothetical protein
MTVNSWLHLRAQDARHALPESLRQRDPRGARDCGWVEQMIPFIRSHASEDAGIIDPFCGFGSTLVAAALEGVPAAGVELDAERAMLARERLALLGADPHRYPVLTGNLAQQATRDALAGLPALSALPELPADGTHRQAGAGDPLPARRKFTLCMTSVPYFGCPPIATARQSIASSPSGADTEGQLYGMRFYQHFLNEMREVFLGVHALLEPGGWCVVMAQNLRLADTFVPLAWDVARILGERFVLHEERLIVYDAAHSAQESRVPAPTNRAHEYALICRKQSRGLDEREAYALLDALAQQQFEFLVYGSLARRMAGEHDVTPNDIDLLCPPDDAQVSRLVRWLEAQGFRLESWNSPVSPPLALGALAYRYYFRARRVDALGATLQVDIAIAETRLAFDGQAALARRDLGPGTAPFAVLAAGAHE